jgi:trk system potassium uptake protein TrkH
MNANVVLRCVGGILLVVGATMSTAFPVGLMMGDSVEQCFGVLSSAVITMLAGGIAVWFCRSTDLGFREGFGVVTFGWIASSLFGALPFVWDADLSLIDGVFETMSGFSTTGASILTDIEALPYCLLYWRSMTHWLGGMGIVVLSLAIMPILGIGGMQLYRAEAPGPTSDQLAPRITTTAKYLWGIYLLLTVAETLLLLPKMSLFDAWCHTCGTLATGGFSTRNTSLAFFDSAYVDGVVTVFMFLAGVNFVLHLRALRGRPLFYFKDEEFRAYFAAIATGVVTIGLFLYIGNFYDRDLATILRHSAFTTVSVITTTGFCTENFDIWPPYARCLLLLLMFVGGCGGSTGGGIKVSRILLLVKYAVGQLTQSIYPRAVANLQLNGQGVSASIMAKILGFFFIFVSIFFALTLAICAFEPNLATPVAGIDAHPLETALSASIATLGNIGPGLGKVGATQNFSWFAPHTKLMLILAMLVGRLEVYTVVVLFLPKFWRR